MTDVEFLVAVEAYSFPLLSLFFLILLKIKKLGGRRFKIVTMVSAAMMK